MSIADPSTLTQAEEQCSSCQKLQRAVAYWKDRALKAERELSQERAEKQQRKLLWRTKLKPAEKATIEEFQRQLDSPNAHHDAQGFTRITFKTAGINIGMTDKTARNNWKKTLEQCPDLLQLANAETETRNEYDPEQKRDIPRLYVKAEQSLIDAAINSEISKRKVQGGNQYVCLNPQCGSDNVRIDRRLVCLDCGHTSELEPTFPNGKLNSKKHARPSRTNLDLPPQTGYSDEPTTAIEAEASKTNLEAPPTNPENFLPSPSKLVSVSYITSEGGETANHTEHHPEDNHAAENDHAAARLLLECAGTSESHIIMQKEGEAKYKVREGELTLRQIQVHLSGKQTYGANLEHFDATTRMTLRDADCMEDIAILESAARRLADAGYRPLLEYSPALAKDGNERRSHLIIVYSERVNAEAALCHEIEVAPELAKIKEYWPNPQAHQKVRLPAGKYNRPGYGQWCKLVCVDTGEDAREGWSAARLLLTSMTPVSVVPVISSQDDTALIVAQQDAPSGQVAQQGAATQGDTNCEVAVVVTEEVQALTIEQELAIDLSPSVRQKAVLSRMDETGSTIGAYAAVVAEEKAVVCSEQHKPETLAIGAATMKHPVPIVDDVWEARYGPVKTTTRWFAVMPDYVAKQYNDEHDLDEIHPRERNGLALSPNGGERTASTSYHQGKFYDHSLNGRREDGRCDSGDALELASKIEKTAKPEIFRMTTGQIISKARAELEAAARAGRPIPTWLEYPVCIITDAGRRHYEELLTQTATSCEVEETGTQMEEGEIIVLCNEEGQGETLDDYPHIREGMRVSTPSGIGVVSLLTQCSILNRPRCRVNMGSKQENGTNFLTFDLSQVQPMEQKRLL